MTDSSEITPYPPYTLVINGEEIMTSNDITLLQSVADDNYSITLNGKEAYSQEIE